jgi:WD40 repeat protein
MSQFNWQQDAEDHWEETIIYTPEPEQDPRRRLWWLIPIILLALGLAGWLVYRQANQRVIEATTAVTTDVLSSHNLLLQAAYNKDMDLFIALLSGRNAQWTAAQEAMLPADTFLNRPSFGLYAAFAREPDLTTTENHLVSLDFAPDLLSAELILSHLYTYTLPNGRNQTTTLQQTAVYRRGSHRWLYAPPEADFWGNTRSYDLGQLIVVYPLRDDELARRLALDLEQMLNELCRTLDDINCPDDMAVTLVLSPDSDTFVNLTDSQTLWESGLRVVLPTPTLVGLPVDEAGYRALLRGYNTQVATAIITHLVDWECCDGAPFYQALLDYQLSQLNLRSWPVVQANYQRVLDEEISLRSLVPYWNVARLQAVIPEDRWLIYTVTDFLLQSGTHISPAASQRTLNDWRGPLPWLENHLLTQADAPGPGSSSLLRKWYVQAAILSHLSDAPPPLPWPDQDLQLICSVNTLFGREGGTLYRYKPTTGQWLTEYNSDSLPIMNPFPDDSALVLQNFNEAVISTIIWQDGQIKRTIQSDGDSLFSLGQMYPTGQLLAYDVGPVDEGIVPQLIDLDLCQGDQCSLEARPGLLAWSPDGRQTIIADPFSLSFNSLLINGRKFLLSGSPDTQDPYTLYRTDGSQRIPIGTGYDPFWIDNETYGYLRPSGINNLEIVVAKTADDIPQVIINSDFLRTLLPTGNSLIGTFVINYVLVDPHNSARLFVVSTLGQGDSPRDAYIFTVEWQSSRFSLRVADRYIGPHTLDLSPDGRWLINSRWDETVNGEPVSLSGLRLYDLERHQSQNFVTIFPMYFPAYLYDWSANGQWLAMLADDNKIALTIPGTDYYQIIQHEHGNCVSVVWINPIE